MRPAPKKSLGQHFLRNDGVCRRIVALLAPASGDQILEIGPGPGALTVPLLEAPHSRLVLVEKDDYWAQERAKAGGAEVLRMDALQYDWAHMGSDGGMWKITGNLPYNVASPLIWDILGKCHCWQRAVFMVQKEVGQRLAAQPGSRLYGALSVWAQCHARTRFCFSIGPGAFQPPPKVDSAVVLFEPLPQRPQFPEALSVVLKICFQKRRKQLGNIFRGIQPLEDAMSSMNLDARLRPENLSCADFMGLAASFSGKPY